LSALTAPIGLARCLSRDALTHLSAEAWFELQAAIKTHPEIRRPRRGAGVRQSRPILCADRRRKIRIARKRLPRAA
jgi:hypothetical protein